MTTFQMPSVLKRRFPRSADLVAAYLEDMARRRELGQPLLSYGSWLNTRGIVAYQNTYRAAADTIFRALASAGLVVRTVSARGAVAYVPTRR